MKERPILFGVPMARAFVDGLKTQTRRPIKPEWSRCLDLDDENDRTTAIAACPYGVAGDRLWGKEAHAFGTFFSDGRVSVYTGRTCDLDEDETPVIYREVYERCGESSDVAERGFAWRPSIFMPRWASRISADVAGVRIEKLGDISEADAIAEGTSCWSCGRSLAIAPAFRPECLCDGADRIARDSYAVLWESIHGPGTWERDRNSHVFVIAMEKR